jgi:hypothetical protein
MASCVGGTSCLVVSDPDFQGQEDCVPYALNHEADPELGSWINLVPDASATERTFRALIPISTCALAKEYTARVFIDNLLLKIIPVPPTGTERREVSVLVDIVNIGLAPGCHKVELLVSGQFAADLRAPARPDDIAKAVWLFYDDPNVTPASCGAL